MSVDLREFERATDIAKALLDEHDFSADELVGLSEDVQEAILRAAENQAKWPETSVGEHIAWSFSLGMAVGIEIQRLREIERVDEE